MTYSATTGVGETEEGESYDPLHTHVYFIGEDNSGSTQTAVSTGQNHEYHAHAIEKEDDTRTMVTDDHFHKLLSYFDKTRGLALRMEDTELVKRLDGFDKEKREEFEIVLREADK